MNVILIFTAIGAVGLLSALYQMRTQPKGLYILFFAEMWERFSYYGMRALLVFYLTKHFLFEQSAAYGLYGAYTTLVFITPVIGGVLADRYLGHQRAVMIGAVLLVLGHMGMAIEGEPVVAGEDPDPFILNIFYLSLALIIMGVGFLKGNISAIVGQLYAKTDVRRDSGFTFFYVGINAGSFFGALYAGYLGETFGWQYGFGLAGIGMLVGLIVFAMGRGLLNGAGETPDLALLKKKQFLGLTTEWLIYIATLGMLAFVWWVVRDQGTVGTLLYISMGVTYLYILGRSVMTLEPHARDRIFAALFLITVQVLFWALFEQAGSSLNVYADEQVDRTLLGQEVPASVFQSLNAMYIVFLGPVFAFIWSFLGKRGMEPSAPQKFGLGVIQLGLGFLVLVWGASTGQGLTPVVFIFLIYLLHTTGELCLSPVGLSAMTRLSTARMVGLIMGAWFLASGAGNFVAGLIAQATAAEGPNGESLVLDVYSNVGWMAVWVGIGLIIVSPLINYLMHLKTLTDDDHPLAGEKEIGEPQGPGPKPARK
ncbi:peptide MFS transporter [Hyphococcus flavus]|uniref:Peptide MFS transporter n=1 Tax=Hyphococcus flavus TaxID=1866326 RepID=A0AAE9ZKS1_9PROT|nr:peptide MFS transporter [Hyphococcus flavus]WDI32430.1 peptide MFS transporter [Hyphococcus flavus]